MSTEGRDAAENRLFAGTKLPMPVLAIAAASSVGDRLERSLVPLTTTLRGIVFDDCGHFIPDDEPERLARELKAFFAEPSTVPDQPA